MNGENNLAQRIEIINSVLEIKNLKYSYWAACDQKEPKTILDSFYKGNVHIDFEDFGIFTSANDMVEKYKLNSCHPNLIEQHAGKNPIINVISSNKALGLWGLSYNLVDTKRKIHLTVNGTYSDEYIKVNNGWLMSKSRFRKNSTTYKSFIDKYLSQPKIGKSLGFKKLV